jgi:DNA-binding NarL/FixJ family response regulator
LVPAEQGDSVAIKLLIADDHAFVRNALSDLFADTGDIDVVAQCTDGSQVADAVGRTLPDVVLMDLEMPRMTGLEAARELLGTDPTARVVMLTGVACPRSVSAAQELGVAGYLLKDDDPGELADQVRAVAAGGTVWSAAVAVPASCN